MLLEGANGALVCAVLTDAFAIGAFEFPFAGSGCFALANGGGLLVMFAPPHLAKDTGFFASTAEPAQNHVERFVLSDFNLGHRIEFLVNLPFIR